MSAQALQRLLEGNRRFVSNQPTLDGSARRRTVLAHEQNPFAIIFGCVDSRVPPELIFDQGLGELFVIRTAGEVLDHAAQGSIEFGVEELHIPLLVVLGHQHCGAVKATMDVLGGQGKAERDIQFLVIGLAQAVEEGKRRGGDVWEAAGQAQVTQTVERLRRAHLLAEAVGKGALTIVGAWYSLETGRVEIIGR